MNLAGRPGAAGERARGLPRPLAETPRSATAGVPCPFDLALERIAAFLNCELPDHPIYTGLEVQRFDDDVHGQGLLVFLGRRDDGRVDVYAERGLRLDTDVLDVGAGVARWIETRFLPGRLEVVADGVAAEIGFSDVDGRAIEVRIDDRDGRRRQRGALLAPFGATTQRPRSLPLVEIRFFDLVRRGRRAPVVTIDGHEAVTGVLPGARLHGRELVKYGTDLAVVRLNRSADAGPGRVRRDPGHVLLDPATGGVAALVEQDADRRVRLTLDPPLPPLEALAPGAALTGRWTLALEQAPPLTGGTWQVRRRTDAEVVDAQMDVTRRWRPRGLPALMRLVTTVIPTFRRWPTTYRWRGALVIGPAVTLTAGWERTDGAGAAAYVRATQGRKSRPD